MLRKVTIKNILGIILGSLLYACGISLFLDPNNLAPGGLVGIAVILSHIFPVETGTWYFILNVPLVILGWRKFGTRFIATTFLAVSLSSAFTNLIAPFGPLTTEPILAGLAGGILEGVGIGIVFRCGATTGGMDILVKILRQYFRHMKSGMLFLAMDIVVVCASGFVFKDFNIVLYALIAVGVTDKMMDFVLYGPDETRLVYIITDAPDLIAKRVMEELDITVTFLNGQGAYSGKEKKVILCALRNRLEPELEQIVREEDSSAFMINSSASEIYGEGYKDITNDKM